MKILFITGCYPQECHLELQKYSTLPLQSAANTFQWAVIEGLFDNKVDFSVVCSPFIPTYPLHYRSLFTPQGSMEYRGRIIGHFLRKCTLVGIKQISQSLSIYNFVNKWCEDNAKEEKLGIIIYTPLSSFLKPVIKLKRKYPQIVIASIITDLIDDALNFSSNRNPIKRILLSIESRSEKNNYQFIDKFVLLSKAMEEKIPESKGKSLVIEGIFSPPTTLNTPIKREEKLRTVLYTGSLQKFAGIIELVDSFMLTKNKSFRLVICGSGECADYIKQKSIQDNRIVFKGVLPREQVVDMQSTSTLLINPRRPDNAITRYSFPSKTMEYLASGTPMLGYKLAGIPEEYYDYYYCVEEFGNEELATAIETCLSKTDIELMEKGSIAKAFILNHKTAAIQVSKILKFLNE